MGQEQRNPAFEAGVDAGGVATADGANAECLRIAIWHPNMT